MLRLRVLAAAGAILLLAACSTTDEEAAPTPEPTAEATASPEATATVDLSDALAEATYLLENLAPWFEEGQRLSTGVTEIAGSANPLSASNEAKALALSVDADEWRDEAYDFDAPAKYDEVQMWTERAGETMADSLNDFWLGIKFNDVDLITSATDKLNASNEFVLNANAALDAID